jgi:hypothetical protein
MKSGTMTVRLAYFDVKTIYNTVWSALHMRRQLYPKCSRLRLKCDVTRAETRFRLSAKRTSPFKSAGTLVQLLAAEVCASAVVMLDTPCSEAVWRVLATHSIRQFPLHFPHPCVTVCHHVSSGLYQKSGTTTKSELASVWTLKTSLFPHEGY